MHLGHWWGIYVLSGIVGFFLTLSVSTLIAPYFSKIGKDSLYYYGLHYCVIWIVDSIVGGLPCAIITLVFTLPLVILYKKLTGLIIKF